MQVCLITHNILYGSLVLTLSMSETFCTTQDYTNKTNSV